MRHYEAAGTASTPCLKTRGYAGSVVDDPSEATDKRPASRRVAADLLERIDAGEYPPGAALPPYRQLATDYDVAVNTAIAAVRVLRDTGAVTIRPNAGAYVRDRSTDIDVAAELQAVRTELAGVRAEVQRAGGDLAKLEERLDHLAGRLHTEGA